MERMLVCFQEKIVFKSVGQNSNPYGAYSEQRVASPASSTRHETSAQQEWVAKFVNKVKEDGVIPEAAGRPLKMPLIRKDYVDTYLANSKKLHAARCLGKSREKHIRESVEHARSNLSDVGIPAELESETTKAIAEQAAKTWDDLAAPHITAWEQTPVHQKTKALATDQWNTLVTPYVTWLANDRYRAERQGHSSSAALQQRGASMGGALRSAYATSLQQAPDELSHLEPKDDPFDAAFRHALDGSPLPADTTDLTRQFSELSSGDGIDLASSLHAPSAPPSPMQMNSPPLNRPRSPSPAHPLQQQWRQQLAAAGPSAVGGPSIQGTKRALPGQALSSQEQTALRNQFLSDLASRFDAKALSALTEDNITTQIDSVFSTSERRTALKSQLATWRTVRTEHLAKQPDAAAQRALFITSTGKTLSASDIKKAISAARSAQAKAAAGGGLSSEQLAPRNALAAMLESDAGYPPIAMRTLTFAALDAKIATLAEPQRTAVRTARDAWHAVWQSAPAGEGKNAGCVLVTDSGGTMESGDIKKAISAARNAQAKAAAGGGLSSEQLAPRNALAAMLESDAGYTPSAMRTLTFAALDAKIATLAEPQKTAVRTARDAWHAVWQSAPAGEGKNAGCVLVTDSGGTMESGNIKKTISAARSAQAKAAAGGGLSSEQLAPRNALAAMLESDAGYTPIAMRTLTFAALDAKIATLAEPQRTAVRTARDAWHAVWQSAPAGEGKNAGCVLVTDSGGTMDVRRYQKSHFRSKERASQGGSRRRSFQ